MEQSILKNKKLIPLFALMVVFAWGCAFPLIKLGLIQFGIDNSDIGSKTLFAGIRFFLAGIITLLLALKQGRKATMSKENINWLVMFALVNTSLHYFFFYMGVSNSFGSRASVLDSMGTFMLVLLACAVFPEEHLTAKKMLGCIIGFAGILLLNLGGESSGSFTMAGDGMIIISAVSCAVGGVMTRIISKKMDILVATGVSLAIGGAFLIAFGLIMGGRIRTFNALGILILAFLIAISVVGFSIYNQLLQYHSVGQIAIYNCLIPVFGVMLSCILLREPFTAKYAVAGLVVAIGVWTVNMPAKRPTVNSK